MTEGPELSPSLVGSLASNLNSGEILEGKKLLRGALHNFYNSNWETSLELLKEVVITGVRIACPFPGNRKSCAVNGNAAPGELGELRLQPFSVFLQ